MCATAASCAPRHLLRGEAPCADAACGSAGRAATCRRACGWCDAADAASAGEGTCADEDIKCETWVAQGECTKNPAFMREGGLPPWHTGTRPPAARSLRSLTDRRLHR